MLHLPQLAIHLDREVNTKGLLVDPQRHTAPIWGLGRSGDGDFRAWVASMVGDGATADDVIKAQDQHLRESVSGGDAAHGPALEEMKARWRHPVRAMGWYRDAKKAFARA